MGKTKQNLADYANWDIELHVSDDETAIKLEVTHSEPIDIEEFIDMLRVLADEFSDANQVMFEGPATGYH